VLYKSTADTTTNYNILSGSKNYPEGYVEFTSQHNYTETDDGASVTTEENNITWEPAWLQWPYTEACEDDTWSAESVLQTTVTVGGILPEEVLTDPVDGEVVAIDEESTVPAGTFTTFHLRQTVTGTGDNAGRITDIWVDVETGVFVKLYTENVMGIAEMDFELISFSLAK